MATVYAGYQEKGIYINFYELYKNYRALDKAKAEGLTCGGDTDLALAGTYADPRVLAPGLICGGGMTGERGSQFSMERQKRILIVEDDLQARIGLQQLMRSMGYYAEGASDWLDALHLMREELFDLAIVDIFLSRTGKRSLNGLDLIPLLRIFSPKVPVVLVTGHGDEQLRNIALKRGATLYLEKPVEPRHLTSIVHRLLAEATDSETVQPHC